MQKQEAAIRRIWENNFREEQSLIKKLVLRHNYISVSAIVVPLPSAPSTAASTAAVHSAASSSSSTSAAAPSSAAAGATASSSSATTSSTQEETYADLRQRPNFLRLIQLGLTLSNKNGNVAKDPRTDEGCIWEFNIKVATSIAEIDESLQQHLKEMGLNVDYNMTHAIHPDEFCRGLWNTDTFMKEPIRWVVFRGGAVFIPMLSILRLDKQLPEWRVDFLDLVNAYFPNFYDVRQLMESCGLSGTRTHAAKVLGVLMAEDKEEFNQAGYDSWLTLQVFLTLRNKYFHRGIPQDRANSIFSIS